jgi:hypothetical protein
MISAISHLATPDFDAIRSMTSEEASKPLVDILRTAEAADERIESLTRRVYALRGAAMKIAEEKKIYAQFMDEEVGKPFRSLDRWNKTLFPKSWRYNAEALATILKLPDVPMEQLASMPRCNMMLLANNVSSNVRALPDVLEAAQTLSEDQFAEKITRDHHQALERRETLRLTYPAGDAAKIKAKLSEKAVLMDLDPSDYAGALLGWVIDDELENAQ